MWFTRTVDGFRGWLPVEQSSGALRTGLVGGDFLATIVNPGDSATTTAPVLESTKTGLYRFDIPSAFLVTHGIGEYGVVVEIDTFAGPSGPPHVRTTFGAVLRVSIEDFDSLGVTAAAILADTAAIDARLPSDPADESNQLAAHAQTQLDVAGVQTTADAILVDTTAIDGRLPADPADESNQLAAHAVTQAAIAAAQIDITRILGLSQDNYMLDNTTYDIAGLLLTGRVRVFASAVALAAASDGAADGADSEIARYSVTVIAAIAGQADDYRFEREL